MTTSPRPHPRLPRRLALAGLSLALAALAPTPAGAQSRSDAFAGRIPPIAGQLYQKVGRFELTGTGNLSVNDAFFTKYFGGLKAGYHFTEHLSLSAGFAAGTAVRTGSAVVCPSGGGCQPASTGQMQQVPGRIRSIVGLEAAWAPVYGKLNVASERVAHFDLSLLAGADAIAYDRILSAADVEAGGTAGTVRAPAFHAGLGFRIFFSEALAARIEFKDYVYRVRVPNWQEGGGAREDWQNQLFAELGLSVFFPFRNTAR